MASFQAKICWKRTRKSENRNCISIPFLPDEKYKTPKKEKKIKKYHCGFISSQNQKENVDKRETIKIIVPFRTNPVRNRKFQKNSGK